MRSAASRRLVLAHVGEQRAAVGVADDVEPVAAGDAQRVVDLDRPPGLDAEVSTPRSADSVRRPTATRTSSPETLAPSSSSTLTRPSPARRPSPWCRRGLDAGVASAAHTSSPANGSSRRAAARPPRQRHAACRATRTRWPSRRRRCRRRGRPGAPAPRSAVVASRLVHGAASRRPGIGGTAASVPVAMTTARRAVSVSSPTCTTRSPVEPPVAAHQRDAAVVEPRQLVVVVEVVDHLVAALEHGLHVERRRPPRRRPGSRFASASTWPGRSSALDGMQA